MADPAIDTVADGYLLIEAPDFVSPGDVWTGEFVRSVAPIEPTTSKPPVVDGMDML